MNIVKWMLVFGAQIITLVIINYAGMEYGLAYAVGLIVTYGVNK